MKLIKKGKQKNNKPKYVIKSHMTDKAKTKIIENAKEFIKDIDKERSWKRKYHALNKNRLIACHELIRIISSGRSNSSS